MLARRRLRLVVALAILSPLAVLAVPNASASLYHFYDGVGDPPPNYPTGGSAVAIFNGLWGAQNFQASASYIFTRAAVWVQDTPPTGDNATLEVRPDNAGNPNMAGPPMASATTLAGASYGWVNFTFPSGVQLTAGTIYWVVLKSSVPTNGQGWNWWNTRNNNLIPPPGVPGKQSNNQGASWGNAPGDFELRTFGYQETNIALGVAVDRVRSLSGDVLTYTLWFNNTGTEVANKVWINDTIPGGLTYLSDNASTIGGVKTGNYNWTFANVAQGSHYFILRARVNDYLAPGLSLSNRARLNYTDFTGAARPGSTASATTVVNLGTKTLNMVWGASDALSTIPPSTTTVVGVVVAKNTQHDWVQAPALAGAFHMRGEATVYLVADSGGHPSETLNVTLLDANNLGSFSPIASSQKGVTFGGPGWQTLTPFTYAGINYTLAVGHSLVLRILNLGGDTVTFATNSTAYKTRVDVVTDTYVAVSAIDIQDQNGVRGSFVYNDTMVVQANVSDPLGAADIRGAKINITDALGAVQVSGSPMTLMSTDPSPRPLWRLYKYSYSIPYLAADGVYSVRITASETNGVATNRSAYPVVRNALFALVKVVNNPAPRQGDIVVYTLYFNNSATGVSPRVWINDTLPSGLAYLSDNASASGGVRTGNYNWSFTNVAPGPHSFWVRAQVLALVPGGTALLNRASLAYLDPKANLQGPARTSASSVVRGPRVDLGLAASKSAYNRAEVVRYIVFFNNTGNELARNVTLDIAIPLALLYQGDSAATTGFLASRSLIGNRLRLQFNNVSVGTHSFVVNATVSPAALGGTPLPGTAYGNYTDAFTGSYPSLVARATPLLIGPRISLTLRVGKPTANPGDTLTYALWVNNTGANIEAAPDLWLWAYVDNATDLAATPPGAVFDAGLHRLAWHLTNVPVGYQGLLRWNATVHLGLAPAQNLVCSAVGLYTDSVGNLAPSMAAPATSVLTAPRFLVSSVGANPYAASGSSLFVRVNYTNTGNGLARWVWINLSIDRSLSYAGQEAEVGTLKINGTRLQWRFGNVTPGPHALGVFLTAGIILVEGRQLNITGTLDFLDGNGNHLARDPLPLVYVATQAPVLSVAIGADRGRVQGGQIVNFTVTLSNRGSSAALLLWVNDTLDRSVKYLDDDSGRIPLRAIDGNRELLSWALGPLAPGEVRNFTIKVQVEVGTAIGTIISNYVGVEHTDGLGQGRVGLRSNTVTIELTTVVGIPEILGFWLPVAAAVALGVLALFLVLRPRGQIMEMFLVSYGGLLMAHLSNTLTPDRDRDILASMLTAIQDFIREAFAKSKEGPLRQMDFGQHRILIQRGAYSYLAVVTRGRTPVGLPKRMKATLGKIEGGFKEVMARWGGDTAEMAGADDLLSEGLLGGGILKRLLHRP